MWYLPKPSDKTLQWYEDTFLDAIANDIHVSDLEESVKNVILQDGNKEMLKRLLVDPPSKLYPLNVELEKKLRNAAIGLYLKT